MAQRIPHLIGIILTFALLLLVIGVPAYGQNEPDTLIEDIDIRGNRRIPKESVLYYVQSKPKDRFDQALVQSDLQSIIQMGMFDPLATKLYIEDGPNGGKIIIFQVKEYPIIRDLQYRGMKSVTESEVLTRFKERKVNVSKESQLDPSRANGARIVLRELLAEKGRPNSKVDIEIEDISATTVALVFKVEEGPRVRIKTIEFVGERSGFSQRQFRGAMKLVKEAGILSSFTSKDIYFKEKLAEDMQRLQFFLGTKGYLQAKIGEPTISNAGKTTNGIPFIPLLHKSGPGLKLSIPVEVGRRYKISDVVEKGVSIFQPGIVSLYSGMRKGDWVDAKKIQENIYKGIKDLYGTQGYIQADIAFIPKFIDKTDSEGDVEVTLEVDEGRQFSLRRLEFIGNVSTRDVVLRREVLLNEGDAYNKKMWDYSLLRLNQIGLFDEIKEKDSITRTNDRDQTVDIDLQVKEKGKQQIQLNGSTGGTSGSAFGVEYSTNNFMGYGESLGFAISGGTQQSSASFSFTEPYFMGKPISLGFQLFASRAKNINYNDADSYAKYQSGGVTNVDDNRMYTSRTTGGAVSIGGPMQYFTKKYPSFTRFSRLGLSYSFTATSISDPEVNKDSDTTNDVVGSYNTPRYISSRLTPTFSFNTKNAQIDATQGQSLILSMGIAGGILGGDLNLLQPTLEYQRFQAVLRKRSNKPHVLAMRFRASHIRSFGTPFNSGNMSFIGGMPISERFHMGGDDTLRGYNAYSISPVVPYRIWSQTTSTPIAYKDNGSGTLVAADSGYVSQKTIDAYKFVAPNGTNGCTEANYASCNTLLSSYSFTSTGGDSQLLYNLEYRVPIFSMLSIAAFADVGTVFNSRRYDNQTLTYNQGNQNLSYNILSSKDYYSSSDPVATTYDSYGRYGVYVNSTTGDLAKKSEVYDSDGNVKSGYQVAYMYGGASSYYVYGLSERRTSNVFGNLRSSLGMEFRVQVPVINIPFRLIFAYNPNPRTDTINDPSILGYPDKRTVIKFSVGRSF